jgi:adenylyl-sulfate kinase
LGRSAPEHGAGLVVWFTGMSGSGKTTLSTLLSGHLRNLCGDVRHYDGDIFRARKNNTDFSRQGRIQNIDTAREFVHASLAKDCVSVVSFITPYECMRTRNRECFGRYLEIYCKCDLDVLIARDAKGLYAKALAGELPAFTGISDSFEEPARPDIVVHTGVDDIALCLETILRHPAIEAFSDPDARAAAAL